MKRLVSRDGGDARAANATDGMGRTPLHLAAEKGLASLVWPLISHGATVQARDGEGATPLHRYTMNWSHVFGFIYLCVIIANRDGSRQSKSYTVPVTVLAFKRRN